MTLPTPPTGDQANTLISAVQSLGLGVEASNKAIGESNERIADSNKAIAQLNKSGQRSRHLIIALAVSLLFDIVLSVILGFTAVSASNSSDKATIASRGAAAAAAANAASAHALCLATNDSRASGKAIWDHVLGLVVPQSAASRAVIDEVKHLVAKTYAPRVCK